MTIDLASVKVQQSNHHYTLYKIHNKIAKQQQ